VYDVSGDGHRFIVATPGAQQDAQPLTLVSNWPALLKKPWHSRRAQKSDRLKFLRHSVRAAQAKSIAPWHSEQMIANSETAPAPCGSSS